MYPARFLSQEGEQTREEAYCAHPEAFRVIEIVIPADEIAQTEEITYAPHSFNIFEGLLLSSLNRSRDLPTE